MRIRKSREKKERSGEEMKEVGIKKRERRVRIGQETQGV